MEALRSISTLSMLAFGLDHPEGVAWGPDGKVYAGGELGQLYRIDLASGSFETVATNAGGFSLGIAHDSSANSYICDQNLRQIIRVTPDGRSGVYSAGLPDRPIILPNYPVFDAVGNLYFSDSGGWGEGNGCIWRVTPSGETTIWDTQAKGFTNGMCLAPDGRALIVVESTPPLIARVPILDDGSAGTREIIVELPRTVPDGVAFDVDGALYISLYNPNIIYRFKDGRLEMLYDDWEQFILVAPTNIAFGGADMKTLLIANLCGWHLATAPMDAAGLPVKYPTL